MTEHTPTPWTRSRFGIAGQSGKTIADLRYKNRLTPLPNRTMLIYMETNLNIRNEAKGKSFRVVSTRLTPPSYAKSAVDYDYCGSIKQALQRIAERTGTELYREVYAQRVRLTKGRKPGTRRWLLASDPIGTVEK